VAKLINFNQNHATLHSPGTILSRKLTYFACLNFQDVHTGDNDGIARVDHYQVDMKRKFTQKKYFGTMHGHLMWPTN
jgi:hypothetical protein